AGVLNTPATSTVITAAQARTGRRGNTPAAETSNTSAIAAAPHTVASELITITTAGSKSDSTALAFRMISAALSASSPHTSTTLFSASTMTTAAATPAPRAMTARTRTRGMTAAIAAVSDASKPTIANGTL